MGKIRAKNYRYEKETINDLYEVVKLIFDKMKLDDRGFPQHFEYAAAFVVNSCIFCEICLKVLILKNGEDVEMEHDLVKLYNELPCEQRRIISQKTMSKIAPGTDYYITFQNCLKKEKDNFVVFRYLSFPSTKEAYTCCSFLKELTDVLHEMV